MAKRMYTEEYIQDIATAIREKNKKTDTYNVSEMAEEIRKLGGDGPEISQILKDGVISTNSGFSTATFADVSNYQYIYVKITENKDRTTSTFNYNRIVEVKPTDIGNGITIRVGRLWDSADLWFTITKTSITAVDYSNKYRYIYADIIGSNEPIF